MGILVHDGRQSTYIHPFPAPKPHRHVSKEEQRINSRQSWAQGKGHLGTRDIDTVLKSKKYLELY